MAISLLFINSALLALALLNSFTMRKPEASEEIAESIAVLLPVRNEEENVERILGELLSQENCPHLNIYLLNDNSTDNTLEIARSFTSPSLHILDIPEPPAGWIGKVNALHHGLTHLQSDLPDYIISIDADVTFTPSAMASSINTIRKLQLDFISPYPRQIARTWGERLIQPLLQWSWMSTLFLRGSEKYPLPSTVVCNGQFLVLKSSSLVSSGGFAAISDRVLDDMELGRSLVRSGFKGAVIDGSELASTRMYRNFDEVRKGYGKSLHLAFGGGVASIFTALFIFATGVLPLILAISGNAIALAALIAITMSRLLAASMAKGSLRDSLLHPLSSLLFIYLLYYSWRNKSRAQWKGRTL